MMQSKAVEPQMKLKTFLSWKLDQRVSRLVESTCFRWFLKMNNGLYRQNCQLLTALIQFYDTTKHCFCFEKPGKPEEYFLVDFGLEDVLYITGLSIDGEQVSGFESGEVKDTIMNHLKINEAKAESLLFQSAIKTSVLQSQFEKVPADIEDLEPYLKAYLLFLLGTVVLPNNSNTVSAMYLPLLGVKDVNKYAWGAAMMAVMKDSLRKAKENKKTTSLCGFSYALTVFALERFPCLTEKGASLPLPSGFPLILGWMERLCKPNKDTKNVKLVDHYLKKLKDMEEKDVVWEPYNKETRDLRFSEEYSSQLRMIFSRTPCICFYATAYSRPDLCFKQLGQKIADLNHSLPDIIKPNRIKLSQHKKKNWRSCNDFYTQMNEEWTKRYDYFVSQTAEHEEDRHGQGFGVIVHETEGGRVADCRYSTCGCFSIHKGRPFLVEDSEKAHHAFLDPSEAAVGGSFDTQVTLVDHFNEPATAQPETNPQSAESEPENEFSTSSSDHRQGSWHDSTDAGDTGKQQPSADSTFESNHEDISLNDNTGIVREVDETMRKRKSMQCGGKRKNSPTKDACVQLGELEEATDGNANQTKKAKVAQNKDPLTNEVNQMEAANPDMKKNAEPKADQKKMAKVRQSKEPPTNGFETQDTGNSPVPQLLKENGRVDPDKVCSTEQHPKLQESISITENEVEKQEESKDETKKKSEHCGKKRKISEDASVATDGKAKVNQSKKAKVNQNKEAPTKEAVIGGSSDPTSQEATEQQQLQGQQLPENKVTEEDSSDQATVHQLPKKVNVPEREASESMSERNPEEMQVVSPPPDEKFVWPWVVILSNLPKEYDEKTQKWTGKSLSGLRNELTQKGFSLTSVYPVWNKRNGFTGFALLRFKGDFKGFDDAIKFEKRYGKGVLWNGYKIFGMVAKECHWVSKGDVWNKKLKEKSELRSVSELEKQKERLDKRLAESLCQVLENINKCKQELQQKLDTIERDCESFETYKQELSMNYRYDFEQQYSHTQKVYQDIQQIHESSSLEVETMRTRLEERTRKSRRQEASVHDEILELELEKQELELELDLVLMGSNADADFQESITKIQKDIKDRETDLQEIMNSLLRKERMTNNEYQDARKELITFWNNNRDLMFTENIQVKRIGSLCHTAILAEMQNCGYTNEAAVSQAYKFCSEWELQIEDVNWHPFKVDVSDGEEPKRVVIKNDDKLLKLENDWGEGVLYNEVVRAKLEILDHNPSGGYMITDLWNVKENREATMEEATEVMLKTWIWSEFAL